MSEENQKNDKESKPGKRVQTRTGIGTFRWTLALLLLLAAVYVIAHVSTFQERGYLHYGTVDTASDRQEVLLTVAVLEDQLETPSAVAKPAVQALLHDLEQSVLRAETSEEVDGLFETSVRGLARLGVQEDVSPKILEAAHSQASAIVSATEEEREVPRRLFQAELAIAEEWALDALGAPALLEETEQLTAAAETLGYDANTKIVKTLADIRQELKAERPNRRLAAEMMGLVADEIRGPQSVFWSHAAMRWLEVVAWSLAGMLIVRLWSIGKYIATDGFDPKWNSWWWAKIIQAPLLAMGVVLALSYFELGVASGETLGFKLSLQGQPMELVVAVSLILGMFSDKAYAFLTDLADKVLPAREPTPGEKPPPEAGGKPEPEGEQGG